MEKIVKHKIIIDYLKELFPDARCELNYKSDVDLLVAIVLSAQATDKSVNKISVDLFKKYKTWEDYNNVDIKELEQDIKSIGLYRNKAKSIKGIAKYMIDNNINVLPADEKFLESLPGVGRKTSNVFLSEWYKIPKIAVDTHVTRTSKRLRLANVKDDVLTIEKKLMKFFNKDEYIDIHHRLIHFGRYICLARNPKCEGCKFKDFCKKDV